jgi:hypothetical protein
VGDLGQVISVSLNVDFFSYSCNTSYGLRDSKYSEPGLVMHACNPSTWEAEARGPQV